MKNTFGIDDPALPTMYPGALFRWLLSEGYSSSALLADTHILERKLMNGDSMMSYRQHQQLISNAISLTNNPHLGAEFGQQLNITSHGMLGFAAMSASTFSDAIDIVVKYFSTRAPVFSLTFKQAEGSEETSPTPECKLIISESLNFGEIRYFLLESFLCSTIKALHFLLGTNESKIRAAVSYDMPDSWAAASSRLALNFELAFGQTNNAVIFPAHYLNKSLAMGDINASSSALEACEVMLDSTALETGLILRIENSLKRQRHTFNNMDQTARELCVSSRTLRRELAKLDTSYQVILDDVKRQLALEKLIQTNMPINVIADLIGFSDPSNFSRAFKKWTGKSPKAYRVGQRK